MKILGLTEFIPDKLMIRIQYRMKTRRKLNLKNPTRFNEKLQWYKLYYRNSLLTQCTDKYRVREYVESKKLSNILIPLYGAYDSVDQIDFEALPTKFVLKTNNGGGSRTNIICKNKAELDVNKTKNELNSWLNKRTVKAGREWAYYDIKPKIICEKFLEAEELIDYKFYCFEGIPSYIKVVKDAADKDGPSNGIFNMEFKQLPYCRTGVKKIDDIVEKPKNFERMCEIAAQLSKDFPHVRVDLYNLDGNIFFGELTFYDTSGYQVFEPDEFDFILGENFNIEKIKRNEENKRS